MSSVPPSFQMFECVNPTCRLRFPSDLSVETVSHCPFCTSPMLPVGIPFSNYHRDPKSGSSELKLCIILDNLRSSQNVGSIFRSADGAGIVQLYCCGTTPTPDHPKVRKSSLGAEKIVAWSYHQNTVDLVTELKSNGNKIIALEDTKLSTPLYDFKVDKYINFSAALVIGNEISGIDPEILSLADEVLHLPMLGSKNSLNAAVAAGIAMYHLTFEASYSEKR